MQPLSELITTIQSSGARLIAVSKTKSAEEIINIYNYGIRHFGENRVQELIEKQKILPKDIHWHMIGHLQRNKVKSIIPFIYCIQSMDSRRLLKEVNKQAQAVDRRIRVYLQCKIAEEDTKYGLSLEECEDLLSEYTEGAYPNLIIDGLMGMATFTSDDEQVRGEFMRLKVFYERMKEQFSKRHVELSRLSMGMSGDFRIALECGSNEVRIGSLIFGPRN